MLLHKIEYPPNCKTTILGIAFCHRKHKLQICFISHLSVPSRQPCDPAQHDIAKLWDSITVQLASCTLSHSKIHEHRFLGFFFISRIFTNHVFLFPGETCVCVCVRAPKLWVPHSHSYASASYQGLLCLIELRSCFPFISQMQWRVILHLPNKNYKTGYTAFKTSTNKRKSEAHWAIMKKDNKIWRVCAVQCERWNSLPSHIWSSWLLQ